MTEIQRQLLRSVASMPHGVLGEFSVSTPDKRVLARLTSMGLLERIECRNVIRWQVTLEGRQALETDWGNLPTSPAERGTDA